MFLDDLSALDAPQKQCLEKVARVLDDAIDLAKETCKEEGVDAQLFTNALVSALLINAASSAYIGFQDAERNRLALCFIRAATDALINCVGPNPVGSTAH